MIASSAISSTGSDSVALTAPLPLNFESWGFQFAIEGRPDPSGDTYDGGVQYVTSGYFRSMAGCLYGVGASDPITYGIVLLTLGIVALIAALAPALNAARTDPVNALRCE
jgi:hypothetical protein